MTKNNVSYEYNECVAIFALSYNVFHNGYLNAILLTPIETIFAANRFKYSNHNFETFKDYIII